MLRIATAAAACLLLTAAALPENAPLPQTRPGAPAAIVAPAPVPRPEAPKSSKPTEPDAPKSLPAAPDETSDQPAEMQGPPRPPLTIASETDADHQACETELQALGATFKDIPRIDDGNGCGIDKPILLSEALPGIKVKPEGKMRCATALALAHWMKESVIPAAGTALKDAGRITTINQASTYICRLRNNATTGKISEHARGNAIDVASFTFEKGTSVAVEPRREDSTLTGAFQRTVSAAGCLYFATVLDPESDAAHEHHFHLDVISRNGGFRYCH
ncbi:extensin-like domain-containing protein [Rhizobium sp. RAF56]|jgi:hypothetical protein|uniref:extensin-like domain-containing protein n=1 Tax=Rhizobium sp. RAF56 TaxID=3233062 RepID=UPI003F9EB1CC